MTRKKQDPNRVDVLLDELLEEHQSPEEILGESGLLKQLSKRLIERALAGELTGTQRKRFNLITGKWSYRFLVTGREVLSQY
jgi:hypothetical protein